MSKNKHIKYSVVLSDFSVKLCVIITQRTTEETLRYTEGNNLKTLIFDNSIAEKKTIFCVIPIGKADEIKSSFAFPTGQHPVRVGCQKCDGHAKKYSFLFNPVTDQRLVEYK